MSEKRITTDRLEQGVRRAQRSSGDIDHDQTTVSQPNQPKRTVTAEEAGADHSRTRQNIGEVQQNVSDSDLSDSDLSAAKLIEIITQAVFYADDDDDDVNDDINDDDSSTLKDLNSPKSSVNSLPSDLLVTSLRDNSSKHLEQEDRAPDEVDGRPVQNHTILQHAPTERVPSMVPLRRSQPAYIGQDSSALLEPRQRLVKVQPAAGQRQPGAYLASSIRRFPTGNSSNNNSRNRRNQEAAAAEATQPQQRSSLDEEDLRSDAPLREQGSGVVYPLTMLEPDIEAAAAAAATARSGYYGATGDSVAGQNTFVTASVQVTPEMAGGIDAGATAAMMDKRASRRRLYWTSGSLMMLLAVGLGVGLGIALSGSSDDGSNNDKIQVIPSPTPTPESTPVEQACTLTDILEECRNGETEMFAQVPACLLDRYDELVVQNLDSVPDSLSCQPENLARLSVALYTTNKPLDDAFVSARFGLSILFFATRGSEWDQKANWLSAKSPCDWYGVSCDLIQPGVVIGLNIPGNNLQGSLPSSIFRFLPSLQACYISDNSLTGPFPTAIADLSYLALLQIARTQMTGTFPFQTFAASTNMGSLDISSNFQLDQSTFPTSFAGTQWKELNLDHSQFEPGPFPAQLLSLTNLGLLNIAGTKLSGTVPTLIRNLPLLKVLRLDDNSLNGTLPTELGILVNLQELALDGNQFSGTIPSELGRLTFLESLTIYRNDLTGTMPTELGKLTDLEKIIFDFNNFDGVIPDEVCALRATGFTQFGNSGDNTCVKDFGGLRCPTEECCNC